MNDPAKGFGDRLFLAILVGGITSALVTVAIWLLR